MKRSLVQVCLASMPFLFWEPAYSTTPTEQSELSGITSRVYAGDYSALSEVAKMPASVAVPYLYWWTGRNPNQQQREIIRNALRQVQGYANYLQQDMANASSEGVVPVYDFDILQDIGTPKAAAVVAPYLFDFKTITPPDRDLAGESNVGDAVWTLQQMKLPDAPNFSPQTPNSTVLVAWQRWAIAKGFVPESWISRVGAPIWLKELDAYGESAPAPAKSPKQLQAQGPPASAEASAAPSASAPPVVQPSAPSRSALVMTGAALVLLILGGIITWKRRA